MLLLLHCEQGNLPIEPAVVDIMTVGGMMIVTETEIVGLQMTTGNDGDHVTEIVSAEVEMMTANIDIVASMHRLPQRSYQL